MTEEKPFFLSDNAGFIEATEAADFLHTDEFSDNRTDELTETQYFSFGVPEHQIQGFGYLWHHPNLNLVSGGIQVWKGHKSNRLMAEIFDYQTYMNDSVLRDGIQKFKLANGYGVEVVEPLKRHKMSYQDADRDNSVELTFEAVSPAVMFADGNHFEQAMRCIGKIKLRGSSYDVNSMNIRDRSWGKPRPEAHVLCPPLSWITIVFNEDFAINCTLFDSVDSQPGMPQKFALSPEQILRTGWIWRDGKIRRIVSATKAVNRDIQTLLPNQIQITLIDDTGDKLVLDGLVKASCEMVAWPNFSMMVSQMQWTCGKLVGHGECQDGFWTDYLNALRT